MYLLVTFKETTCLLLLKDTGGDRGSSSLCPLAALSPPDRLMQRRLLSQLRCTGCGLQPWRFSAGRYGEHPAAGERGVGSARESPVLRAVQGDADTSGTRRQIAGTSGVNFACYREANLK